MFDGLIKGREPYAMKVARTVLRGETHREAQEPQKSVVRQLGLYL